MPCHDQLQQALSKALTYKLKHDEMIHISGWELNLEVERDGEVVVVVVVVVSIVFLCCCVVEGKSCLFSTKYRTRLNGDSFVASCVAYRAVWGSSRAATPE